MNYRVQLDDDSLFVRNLDLRTNSAEINGRTMSFDLRHVRGHLYSLLLEGEVYALQIEEAEGGQRIGIGTRVYRGLVEDERQAVLRKFQPRSETESGVALIKAPMPGLVVRLEVQKGSRVEKGQGLIVIEAMKMENEIKSPLAGTVAEIMVEVRATVEKNAPLVRIQA